MPVKRERVSHLQSSPRKRPKPSSHSLAIAKYHTNEKEISKLQGNPVAQFKLKQKQELEKYQDSSVVGSSIGGQTDQWLIRQLKRLRTADEGPLRLLDVGAISGTAYEDTEWIEATSIDLNPRDDRVVRADFLQWPVPPTPDEAFDIVCLSLVLNFVGNLEERGDMLRVTVDHLKAGGLLYLVLPLACVDNSRYIDHDRLRAVLRAIGYDVLQQHDSAGLTYWLCRLTEVPLKPRRWQKKLIQGRTGGDRNNFAIVLH